MNDTFAQSRAALRTLLGVTTVDQGGESWPRSKVMRAVMNPDNRAAVMAIAAVASLVFPRITRVGALYPLVAKVAKAGRHVSRLRFRR